MKCMLCDNKVTVKGFCNKHYEQYMRPKKKSPYPRRPPGWNHSDETKQKISLSRTGLKYSFPLETKEELTKRFMKNVTMEPNTGCWLWMGSIRNKEQYGSFSFNGRPHSSHQISWQLFRGEIPPLIFVLHHCDTPPCVNPYHLYLGTAKDNVRDSVIRGRHRNGNLKGEQAPNCKLSSEKVKIILTSSLPARSLAELFNVYIRTIYDIKERKTWKHILVI